MNFIELRVEDYIDEVLDSDAPQHENEIRILRRFVQFIDHETEIYSVQDITAPDVLDFLWSMRGPQQREESAEVLNGFFSFLNAKELIDTPLQIDEDMLHRPAGSSGKSAEPLDYFDDEDEDLPRHRGRREADY